MKRSEPSRVDSRSSFDLGTRALAFYGRHFRHPGRWRIIAELTRRRKSSPRGVDRFKSGGYCWALDPSDYQQAGVFWVGEMDRWEIFHLVRSIKNGGIFVDVGANFGYYSVVVTGMTGCKTFAFEPQPSMYAILCGHVTMNSLDGRVFPSDIAFGDFNGFVGMDFNEVNSGKAALNSEAGNTRLCRFDDWILENGITQVDAIKIDIEGAETKFFKGAGKSIEKFKPFIVMEVNPGALARLGSSALQLEEVLSGFGYRFFRVRKKQLEEISGICTSAEPFNVACVPRP